MAFGNLAIIHSDLNVNNNVSHFKPKILEALDHLKDISHKLPQVDSIFDFIPRTTASDITKEALADITNLIKQNINRKSINGRDSFRRSTIDVFSTTDGTSDTDNTQQQKEKDYKDNNKSNSSLQQPAPSFNETDINTLCSSQQLAPKNTTDT